MNKPAIKELKAILKRIPRVTERTWENHKWNYYDIIKVDDLLKEVKKK